MPDATLYLTNTIILTHRRVTKMSKSPPPLSRTELLIMSALATRELYGLEIVDRVQTVTGSKRRMALGSLYPTLARMDDKGLVTGRWGESSDDRRGARRRYYKMTGLGARALAQTQKELLRAWDMAPGLQPAEG